jgi:methylglutaconyl-CoA hydratase
VLLDRLEKEFQKLSEDDNVKVILLKSEGEKAFCAGASFDELVAIETMQAGKLFFSGFAKVLNAMRNCKKLIVGRIQGKTVGGGVGLVAACDYAMATDAAAVKLSEISIGIGPFVIAPAVERKIGVGALSELSLAAHEWKNAYWAKDKGLYARVFESLKDLDKEIDIFTEKLASYNPEALYEMKQMFWKNTSHWDELLAERAAISGELVLSDFTKNALAKYKK